MRIQESFRIAHRNILANKVRSFLSVLGVVIGICAVTVVVSVSNGLRRSVLENLSSFGTNVLYVFPKFEPGNPRVGLVDMDALERISALPFVEGAFPRTGLRKEARGDSGQTAANALGISPRYLEVYRVKLKEGRPFNEAEAASLSRVCLISEKLAPILFGALPPVGRSLRFNGVLYEVVGIVEPSKRPMRAGQQSDDIYIPLPLFLRQREKTPIPSAEVWVKPSYKGDAKEEILDVIAREPSMRKLYQIMDPQVIQENFKKTSRQMFLVMLALAGISLLVGGIGVMNMMLISVSERTREIGLRKAIGAAPRDILVQFLVEVSVLSGLGGVCGILGGLAASWMISAFSSGAVPIAIVPSTVFLAFGFSLAEGVIFGLFPAFKASRLSPVEALRYE